MVAYPKQFETRFCQSSEILNLIAGFEDCTLPLSNWNRTTFITIVFWYLYLNPLAEAEKLMNDSLRRFQFENGLKLMQPASFGKVKTPSLFRKINHFIKIHKANKSFIELANMILEIKELG
jgi:hypothetical protein